ncbi:aminotransferase class V-fold PLP-dependent enzyme [Streptomyces sp. NPDC051563]|uniref:aminotransferase class V-fold PLP-dependent enzyme n=1 Tax=Streptomyces sp. NPDC051563 TaxID=3365659 RepID=UPI0037B3A3AC
MSAPGLLVLKIGGSLISDKRGPGGTDLSAIADYAAQVRDLAAGHPGRVVLITGGGALCHAVGVTVDPARDPWSALALTEPAFTMRWAWTSALRELGVRAVPLQVTAMLSERPDGSLAATADTVRKLLAEGALPVLSSDCVLTADGSLRIVSSDEVPALLLDGPEGQGDHAGQGGPDGQGAYDGPVRIVALTDVPGILTGPGPDSPVLPRLDADDLEAVAPLLWPAGAKDATGAMGGKVGALAAHARRGAQCLITRGDRTAPGLGHLFAPLEDWPKELPYTLIQASRPRPGRTVLLNPGPVNVHPAVRAALGSPDECHREPETRALFASVAAKVNRLSRGDDTQATVLLTGSGTAALEAAVSSVVPPSGRLLVLDNGHYGERLHKIAEAHGIPATRLEFGWAEPVDLPEVERLLRADPGITHVGVVHHETSTGMLNPLRAIGRLVHAHGRQLLVDAISSLGAEELDVVRDHIDWCVGTANKCLEGLPGISFVTAPAGRFEALDPRDARTFSLSLRAHYDAQVIAGAPQFTPAIQVLRAFDTALDLAVEETTEARAARYAARSGTLRRGLAERGIELLLAPEHRANSLTNAFLPEGMTYDRLHDGLKERGYVIYATQAADAGGFRLAAMGRLTDRDMRGLLAALDEVVKEGTEATAR